ncbi:hypothetical protein CASFOL_013214 [Castilleja foliolosa]|uniref:F-box domain-containing protein n=1 Tax=Castilleja foliolosa TaxID=1961234 RepID=A0ABD3DN79_9LAMI
MANSVLPEELVLCILTRLPVKTIIRFKCVCKPWYYLFSSSEFKKLHRCQFSSDPENLSFIIHDSFPKHQVLQWSGQEILLWNPATKLSKTVPLKDCGPNNKIVSLGFGYDAMTADFKVVMIVTSINLKFVEIYSANLDSWITIDVGFQFSWFKSRNDLIVNGNPYWVAEVDGNEVLVCFNVLELVFKIVSLPIDHWMGLVNWDALEYEDTKIVTKTDVNFVDWNGALGALITNHEVEYRKGIASSIECSARIQCVGVWVFDDIQRIWRNYHTFGPIDVDVNKVLNCVKNEKILGTISFDKLCVRS